MACRPPLYCGIIFIVIGIIVAVLAVLPWFLIPNAVEDAVTESAVLTSEKDDGFKEFRDQTKNPLIFNCYFWNITNPDQVRIGAKPIMASVGPFVWKKFAHRINITFASDKNSFQYREWNEYIYDPVLSGGRNATTTPIWTVNTAWVAGVSRGINEAVVGSTISSIALATLKGSFILNRDVTIQYLNTAWANVFAQIFFAPAPTGFAGDLDALAAAYELRVPTFPFRENTDVFYDLIVSENTTIFNRLFNPAQAGSLLDLNATDSWLTCASPVLTVGDLTPDQISRICAWRSVLNITDGGRFKRATDNGGPGYLQTVGGLANPVAPIGPLAPFLPSTYVGDPALVENNIQYIHWVLRGPSVAGLFPKNASLIQLNPSAGASLFNVRPEFGHFNLFNARTFAQAEFPTALATELDFLTAPALHTAAHGKWIFDVLANTSEIPQLAPARIGGVGIAGIVAAIPLFLSTHPLYGPLYATRNFTQLAAVWNATTFPAELAAGVDTAIALGLVKGFPTGAGSLLRSYGVFPASPSFTFTQVFQLYLYLKYQWVVTFIRARLAATASGLIVQVTPEQTMFGRTEPFLGAAVPGVWTDYTIELALQNSFIETYLTGNDDVKNFRSQLTYNGNSSLARYFPLLQPAPTVQGSSLTFIGPYRLISKNGVKQAEDEKLILWVPDVVRELQLQYQSETSLKGIDLYRFEANAGYKSVTASTAYRNPYDFVMDLSLKLSGGFFPFYLTFPGYTLVKESQLFNGVVEGVQQDNTNWILTWDFEPITGLAMRASAPLQLSLPLNTPNFRDVFGTYSTGVSNATIPSWYIIRTNQITDEQADDWKEAVGGALAVQLGLTTAMAVVGGVLFLVGIALLIWRLVAGKPGEMTEFELRN